MISTRRRLGATLVAMAVFICYCSPQSAPDKAQFCPFSAFSGRTLVDADSATGLNYGSDSADSPHMAELSGKIYVAWSEYITADGTDEIQVSAYNGNDSAPGWTRVVGAGRGLNKSASSSAVSVKLAAFDSRLYATWVEDAVGVAQIRVGVYNGDDSAPSWTFVDGNGATGLNKDPTRSAANPQLVAFQAKLYLVWSETDGSAYQIRAAVYNGDDSAPSWTFKDGNGATGLNKNAVRAASMPSAVVYNSKLYLAWQESNGTADQARVTVYNGDDSAPTWTFVDGNGSSGLNKSSAQNAQRPKLVSSARDLVLFWIESNGSVTPIRVRVFNGLDNNPRWTWLDGGGTNGLNADNAHSVETARPAAFMLGLNIFAAWIEGLTGTQSMRLAYYSGSWALQAGTGVENWNLDSTMDAYRMDALVTSNCKVYTSWVETDNGLGTNRLHVSVLR